MKRIKQTLVIILIFMCFFNVKAQYTMINMEGSFMPPQPGLQDQVMIMFDQSSSFGLDVMDFDKIWNNVIDMPNFYATIFGSSNPYYIASMPLVNDTTFILPLGYIVKQTGTNRITLNSIDNFPVGTIITLIDSTQQIHTDFSNANAYYEFNINQNDCYSASGSSYCLPSPAAETTPACIACRAAWTERFYLKFHFLASPGGTPEITTGNPSQTQYCEGQNIQIPFNISGTFDPSNVFTAQLSNLIGDFSSPVNIGTLAGSSSGTINGTIPLGTLNGSGYLIRVISDNPAVTGTASSNTIEINSIPSVSYTGSLPTQCETATTLDLLTVGSVSPSSGTFTGIGVSGTNFDASVASTAGSPHTITYTVVNGACSAYATNSIEVNDVPIVSYTGSLPAQCETSSALDLLTVGSVSPSSGTFTGIGVSGTNFDASVAGTAGSPHTITYTVVNGACSAYATNSIEVDDVPIVSYTGSLPAQCETSSALDLLTVGSVSPSSGTFTGIGVSGTNFDASAAGTAGSPHTITYTVVNGACSAYATNSIEVDAMPSVSFTGSIPTQCETSSTLDILNYASVSPSGGFFLGPGVSGTNFNASIVGTSVNPYTIAYRYVSGSCIATATNTVYVDAAPVVSYTGLLPAQCETSSILDLTNYGNVSPAGGSFSGTGVSGTNFDASVAGTAGSPHTINYTVVNGVCSITATNSIEVDFVPVVTYSGFIPVLCSNITAFDLTGAGDPLPVGGTFSGTGVSGIYFDASIAGEAGSPHTITYTVNNGACSASATNSISVVTSPTVTYTGSLPAVCETSTSFSLYGAGSVSPSGGFFSGTGVTGSNFNASVAGSSASPHTISYTVFNGVCSANATNSIEVNSMPSVAYSGTIPTQCESSTSLDLLNVGTFSPANGTFSGNGINGSVFNASVAGAAGSPHTISYSVVNGACTATATNEINVDASPNASFIGNIPMQCESDSILDLSNYISSSVTGIFSGNGIIGTNFNASIAGSTTSPHTITYNVINGVCSETITNNIIVNPLPSVTFTGAIPPQCDNISSFDLSTAGTISPTGGNFSGIGVTGTSFNPSLVGASINPYYIVYSYTDGNGCSASDSNTIIVNNSPIVIFTGTLTPQCANETIYNILADAIVNPSGGTFSGIGVSGNNFNASVASQSGSSINITYTFQDANSCISSDDNIINIIALPQPTIINTDTTLCVYNPEITLSANPAGGVFSGQGVNGNTFTPSQAIIGMNTIIYTYTDGSTSCVNTDTAYFYVDECVGFKNNYVNNGIIVYPNPANHLLNILITNNDNQKSLFEIYSVYGQRVFEAELSNETINKINISPLTSGLYIMKLNGKIFEKNKLIINK